MSDRGQVYREEEEALIDMCGGGCEGERRSRRHSIPYIAVFFSFG